MSGASPDPAATTTVVFIHGPPACGKLNSPAFYRELKRDGAFHYPAIESELVIDSTSAAPRQSALRIVGALSLPATEPVPDTPPR